MILVGWLAGASLVAFSGCSCSDRTIESDLESDPDHRKAACMWIGSTWGHFADGSVRMIVDEQISKSGSACLCLTEDEYWSQSRHDELNDLALQECDRLAMQHDFVRDECQEDYESEVWYDYTRWVTPNFDGRPPGFTCAQP